MRSLAAAMIMLSACASSGTVPLAEFPAELPPTIHIVNVTRREYRVSLAFGASSRVLGTVPALDARDFVIARRSVLGRDEFYLVALARDGTLRRESEHFPLSNVSAVDWILDPTLTRAVKVR